MHNKFGYQTLMTIGASSMKGTKRIDESEILGWVADMQLTPARAPSNGELSWGYEAMLATGFRVGIFQPKRAPRALLIQMKVMSRPDHAESFDGLEEDAKRAFWRELRSTLNREFTEFQLEGKLYEECPKSFLVTETIWDDGLSLNNFARSISSVQKACLDACALFDEQLGSTGPATGGEFAFKKIGLQ
jgi:hypothetical protein